VGRHRGGVWGDCVHQGTVGIVHVLSLPVRVEVRRLAPACPLAPPSLVPPRPPSIASSVKHVLIGTSRVGPSCWGRRVALTSSKGARRS
jgi:hypothetical protein